MLENAIGTAWWNGGRVNPRKLSRLLQAREWSCDAAYVSVANEREARQAWSILDTLACPYVVHLMDLCHDEGIQPAAMPGYRDLLGHAERVFVASEAIRDEVLKVRANDVDLISVAKRLGRQADPPRAGAGPLRLVMLGSLGSADNPALGVLADALPTLQARWPGFECLYMGQHYDMLPERLQTLVTYPGRVDLKTFEQLLPTAHLAFLPSPRRTGLLWAVRACGSIDGLLRCGASSAVLPRQGLGRGARCSLHCRLSPRRAPTHPSP